MIATVLEPESVIPSADTKVPDPFDPSRLRLSQDFGAGLGVKKALIGVPVRKPSKESWIQTHPDKSYRMSTCVLELKDDRETYLVDPSLWSELGGESTFGTRSLFTSITRQGALFIWPVRMPGPDGKLDTWSASSMEAAQRASGNWVRVASNMHASMYDVFETTAAWPDPQWPSESFADLLRVAFKGKFIDNLSHPVLKRLRGE
jgi:hypothetical protein